jgi:hypothetical protein
VRGIVDHKEFNADQDEEHQGYCLRLTSMAEHANTDSAINEAVRILKLKIPPEDHAALDSRLQELMNDPSTDDDDVISILRDEFDPA